MGPLEAPGAPREKCVSQYTSRAKEISYGFKIMKPAQ